MVSLAVIHIQDNIMKTTSYLTSSKPAGVASTILLAVLWMFFASSHLRVFQATGDWSQLLFCASETVIALLFVFRSEPSAVSHLPIDWSVMIASMIAPLLFVPSLDANHPAGRILIVASTIMQWAGLLSLNRSFGLVAARRIIKTTGMYRLVRHPLYASYLLSYTGYVLLNTSGRNIVVGLAAGLLLVIRLYREERFLRQDADYRFYMRQVKYRLLPMVF
jgi:protein-S-isoprenylcysteine O-methyltransferase Ste14